MDSTAPFPFSAFGPQGEVSAAIDAFRWLVVLGFPVAVAAATVWPDFFTLDARADDEDDRAPAHPIYPPIV